jgi:hypothetical protein
MTVRSKRPSAADYLTALEKPKKAAKRKRGTAAPQDAPEERKVRATYYIGRDVSDRARNAATALMGPPEFLTLAAIVERGVAAEVKRLEKAHNGGKPFPERAAELKGGRRLRR